MYLRECAPTSSKLTRWALALEEFDINWNYTVQEIRTKLQTVCLDWDRRNVTVNMGAWTTYLSNRNIF